jgi:hypothetical protein
MKKIYYVLVCIFSLGFNSASAQELFDDFLGTSVNTTNWTVANTVWGNVSGRRSNGGVVPQNVRVENGNLVIEAHGNSYTGPVAGFGQNTRVGGAISTKRRFASGKYEIRAKIVPHAGALSAFWTYYYENDNYNHEIDFEMPGNNQPPNGPANSNLNYGLMTSWRGVNTGQYQTTDKYFGNQADGNYHLYRFEWHTGGNGQTTRVEWYYDNQLMQTNTNTAVVPNHEGNFWVGVWFPWWIADPNFNIAYMYVDWVRVTPFLEPNDLPAPTTGCTSAPAQPGLIVGNTTVASGSSQIYYVDNVAGATSYTWILPSGWSGTSTTNAITATVGSTGGNISVRANNSCGSSTYRTIAVSVSGSGSSNLALNKTATASSVETAAFPPAYAVDASLTTRWSSLYTSPQWIYVDLGATYNINRVKITWEAAYGKNYRIQVSSNASSWTTIRTVTGNTTLTNDMTGLSGTGRYVRMYGTASGLAGYGYSIYNLEVYGTPAGAREASDAAPGFAESANMEVDVFPNPSFGDITITTKIQKSGYTLVDIIDADGRVVTDVYRANLDAGVHEFKYNTTPLKTGNYFIRVSQLNASETRKMIKVE